ncbi:MAG: hypothetical protein GF331_17860 [Chitinivibrionales bacterium]|nr:hypothetical protein [Chitinivibrionales bacterium]
MIRLQRKRIREVAELCLLCVLVIGACSHARRMDSGSEDSVQAKTRATPSVKKPDKDRTTAPGTFLDTLNAGHEVALRESDVERADHSEDKPEAQPQTESSSPPRNPAPQRPAGKPPSPENVYRIQCMASTQSDAMQKAKNKLASRLDHPVYVMFEDPYYKLLVGEFATRAEAERALFEVQGQGYPDAWIVKGTAAKRR